jgi:hypothetical protein
MPRLQALLLCFMLLSGLSACQSTRSEVPLTGVGMTGIDHLPDHLSVQDYWVNGRAGFQAGKGGSNVCCAKVPQQWFPGAQIEVRWEVANWKKGTWRCYHRMVTLDRYDETGQLFVHFLPDGSVRALLSNYAPWGNAYPGPRIPIPKKEPWSVYPRPPVSDVCPENLETPDE